MKLKRILILLILLIAGSAVGFGGLEYFEKRLLEQVIIFLDRNEPYKALEFFESVEKHAVYRLIEEKKPELMDPLWYYYRGLAELRTGDYPRAWRDFDRSAEGFKNGTLKSYALFNKGEARLWQWGGSAFEEAAISYQEALKYNPELMPAKKRLEWLHLAKLINQDEEGNPMNSDKNKKGQLKKGESKNSQDQPDNEKFKQTEGKQRRGY